MCGIIGIVGRSRINQSLYDGLTVLQHRGQDAAGIVTYADGRFFLRKGNGLVRDVFHTRTCSTCSATWASATSAIPPPAAQPRPRPSLSTSTPRTASRSAHNGNLTNAEELKQQLFARGPAPPQHRLRLGGPAQRVRARAAAQRQAAHRRRATSSRRWPVCTSAAVAAYAVRRHDHRRTASSASAIRTASARLCSACAKRPRATST